MNEYRAPQQLNDANNQLPRDQFGLRPTDLDLRLTNKHPEAQSSPEYLEMLHIAGVIADALLYAAYQDANSGQRQNPAQLKKIFANSVISTIQRIPPHQLPTFNTLAATLLATGDSPNQPSIKITEIAQNVGNLINPDLLALATEFALIKGLPLGTQELLSQLYAKLSSTEASNSLLTTELRNYEQFIKKYITVLLIAAAAALEQSTAAPQSGSSAVNTGGVTTNQTNSQKPAWYEGIAYLFNNLGQDLGRFLKEKAMKLTATERERSRSIQRYQDELSRVYTEQFGLALNTIIKDPNTNDYVRKQALLVAKQLDRAITTNPYGQKGIKLKAIFRGLLSKRGVYSWLRAVDNGSAKDEKGFEERMKNMLGEELYRDYRVQAALGLTDD